MWTATECWAAMTSWCRDRFLPGDSRGDDRVDHAGEGGGGDAVGAAVPRVRVGGDDDDEVAVWHDLDELPAESPGEVGGVAGGGADPPLVAVAGGGAVGGGHVGGGGVPDPGGGHELSALPAAGVEVEGADFGHVLGAQFEESEPCVSLLRVDGPGEAGVFVGVDVAGGGERLERGSGGDTERVEQLGPGVVEHRRSGGGDQNRRQQV